MTDPHKSQVLQNFVDRLGMKFDAELKNLTTIIAGIDDAASEQNKLIMRRLMQLSANLATLAAGVQQVKGVVINSLGPAGSPDPGAARAAVDALINAAEERARERLGNKAAAAVQVGLQDFSKETQERIAAATATAPAAPTPPAAPAAPAIQDTPEFQQDLALQQILEKFGLAGLTNVLTLAFNHPIGALINSAVIGPLKVALRADPNINPYKVLLMQTQYSSLVNVGVIYPEPYEQVFDKARIGLFGRTPVEGVNQYQDLVFEVDRFLVRIELQAGAGLANADLGDYVSVAPTYVSSYKDSGMASWIPLTKLPEKLGAGLVEDLVSYFSNLK